MASKDRADLVEFAKLAEQAERYEEMVDAMKDVAKLDVQMQVDERNLLSVAYKNVIGGKRASWRIISNIERREESKGGSDRLELMRAYKKQIELELRNVCDDAIDVLETHLIPSATDAESRVFFNKMQGDYDRYISEFASGSERQDAAQKGLGVYKKALDIANAELSPTNPIRLGLALNFSVFHYEILNSPEKACELAKRAFDDAIAELDSLPEEAYKDSTLIMQLLRDNLSLWTAESNEDNAGDEETKE